jgi:hypothetical protein
VGQEFRHLLPFDAVPGVIEKRGEGAQASLTGRQKMQSLAPPAPQPETDFANTHNCAFWTALEAG